MTSPDEKKRIREAIAARPHHHMVAQGNGGTILVVPDDQTDALRFGSFPLAAPFRSVTDESTKISNAMNKMIQAGRMRDGVEHAYSQIEQRTYRMTLQRLLEVIGDTSAVDGATVVNPQCELLGFGAKIDIDPDTSLPIAHWRLPTEGSQFQPKDLSKVGMRHQSAARFVAAHPGTRAFVASQDGKLTIIIPGNEANSVQCLEHAEWLLVPPRLRS